MGATISGVSIQLTPQLSSAPLLRATIPPIRKFTMLSSESPTTSNEQNRLKCGRCPTSSAGDCSESSATAAEFGSSLGESPPTLWVPP